jgi:hypothetical protein
MEIHSGKLLIYTAQGPVNACNDAVLTVPEREAMQSDILRTCGEYTFIASKFELPALTLIQQLNYQWYMSKELPRKKKKAYRKWLKAIIILLALFPSIIFAQVTNEYINFYQVKAGMVDKAKIEFLWADSSDYYNALKLRSIPATIQTMESKGFELVTMSEYSPGNLVVVISVYMRRKYDYQRHP